MAAPGGIVLDDSKLAPSQLNRVRPHTEILAHASWARITLCSHPARQTIASHGHDDPYLSIHVLGSYCERSESGEFAIDAPGFALHWPGNAHEDDIGPHGLKAIVIDFDARWLVAAGSGALRPERSRYWVGGLLGRRARRLARDWLAGMTAPALDGAMALMKSAITAEPPPPVPDWLSAAIAAFDAAPETSAPQTIAELARRRGLHPEYLAQCVRRHLGESLAERARRRRVERTLTLLRETPASLADAALTAGYCDQSHMNREFRTWLGRTPAQIRIGAGQQS